MTDKYDRKFVEFCDELREYVKVHHHFPNKHTSLLNKVKYYRRRMNGGELEEWKEMMFREIAEMRDLDEHTGGRRKKIDFFCE